MYKKQLMFFTSLLVLFSAFFFGCNQDEFDAGIDLVPDSLRLKSSATDTFSVVGYTQKVDTLFTNGSTKMLLGKYTDPIFGDIEASFVTEMVISTNSVANDDVVNAVNRDSLVLYFRYSIDSTSLKTYGNPKNNCTIDIKKFNKLLNISDEFNFDVDITGSVGETIGSYTFNPGAIIEKADFIADSTYQARRDSIKARADSLGITPDYTNAVRPNPIAILSIKLPNDFMEDIYEYLVPSISEYTTFVEMFNGFYLSPNPVSENNNISIFDYNSTDTKAVLYYRTENDTLEYNFGLSNTTSHFNIFDHNFETGNLLFNPENSEIQEDSVIYIQGLGGLEAKIKFPYIDELINQGLWAVNRAELIFHVENGTETDYDPVPTSLIVKGVKEDNTEFFLDEYINQSLNAYNGASYENEQYKFDITYYMQKIFNGDYDNNGLILKIPDQATNPSRVVLSNGNLDSNKIKLKLTLTKLSN